MGRSHTSIYCSISVEEDAEIDKLRVNRIKEDKKNYTKADIVKDLIQAGLDITRGKYLKLDPNIDEFVSKLQTMTIEIDGEKIQIKKSKEQVYNMLIQKGIEHLND